MPSSSFSDSVKWRIITSTGTNIAIKYLRDGKEAMAYPVPTNPPTKWYERKALRQISIAPAEKFVIDDVASNSPAALAGLKSGDEIVALNGQKIYSPDAYFFAEQDLSNNRFSRSLSPSSAANEQFERTLLAVKPLQPTNSEPSLGIISWQGDTNVTLAHPNPWQQISDSAVANFQHLRRACSRPKARSACSSSAAR